MFVRTVVLVLSATVLVLSATVLVLSATVLVLSATVLVLSATKLVLERNVMAEATSDHERLDIDRLSMDYVVIS
jgi:hypothetical protein